jgi:uncharacterized protein (TIGR02996 family)
VEVSALEQALREHPDDAVAWLVYGDWLLEHHDVRGTLIQLEHRHAQARAADGPALQREIDALVKQHQASWKAALPRGVTPMTQRYGFATKVSVTWSERAPALIEQALRERFVTALRIVPPPRDDGDDLDDEEELDDDGMPVPPAPLEIRPLAALDLSRLTALDLSYVHIGAAGAKAVAASSTLGRLAALDLRYCRISDQGLAALAAAPLAGSVRRLHLQRNHLTAAGAKLLQRFGRLVELDLRYNDLGAGGAKALLAAPFIGSLTRLGLNLTDISSAGAKVLAGASQLSPALRSYWRSL